MPLTFGYCWYLMTAGMGPADQGARTAEASGRRRRLSRAEQVARNRQELLDAAGRVFRDAGYARASLDAIAEEAGFSKGVIYSQFTSKADLFLTLLEQRIEHRAAEATATALAYTERSQATDLVGHMYALSRADPAWGLAVLEFRVVAARDPALNERYARAHRRAVDGVADLIRTFFERTGGAPDMPAETLAVLGMMIDVGAFLEDLASPGALSEAELSDTFARVAGIGGGSDAAATRRHSDRGV
jgi:AcrR family transcriptional regulator